MRVGIACAGIGEKARPDYIKVTAQEAEDAGFSTLWMGEHAVLFERYPLSRSHSKSPYAKGGLEGDSPIPDPSMPIVEPLTTLCWLAAHTRSIELATCIVIVPQHNPLYLAKTVGTADMLSNGRIVLGVGVGWAIEEYEACGVPWSGRGKRMDEYIAAMRALWRERASTFQGETVSFKDAYSFPKPVRGTVPVLIGGESNAILRRVARIGDGLIAFNMTTEAAPIAVRKVHDWTREEGRDPSALRLVVAVFDGTTADDLSRYRDAGFTEFYYVAGPEVPAEANAAREAIRRVADRFVNVASKL